MNIFQTKSSLLSPNYQSQLKSYLNQQKNHILNIIQSKKCSAKHKIYLMMGLKQSLVHKLQNINQQKGMAYQTSKRRNLVNMPLCQRDIKHFIIAPNDLEQIDEKQSNLHEKLKNLIDNKKALVLNKEEQILLKLTKKKENNNKLGQGGQGVVVPNIQMISSVICESSNQNIQIKKTSNKILESSKIKASVRTIQNLKLTKNMRKSCIYQSQICSVLGSIVHEAKNIFEQNLKLIQALKYGHQEQIKLNLWMKQVKLTIIGQQLQSAKQIHSQHFQILKNLDVVIQSKFQEQRTQAQKYTTQIYQETDKLKKKSYSQTTTSPKDKQNKADNFQPVLNKQIQSEKNIGKFKELNQINHNSQLGSSSKHLFFKSIQTNNFSQKKTLQNEQFNSQLKNSVEQKDKSIIISNLQNKINDQKSHSKHVVNKQLFQSPNPKNNKVSMCFNNQGPLNLNNSKIISNQDAISLQIIKKDRSICFSNEGSAKIRNKRSSQVENSQKTVIMSNNSSLCFESYIDQSQNILCGSRKTYLSQAPIIEEENQQFDQIQKVKQQEKAEINQCEQSQQNKEKQNQQEQYIVYVRPDSQSSQQEVQISHNSQINKRKKQNFQSQKFQKLSLKQNNAFNPSHTLKDRKIDVGMLEPKRQNSSNKQNNSSNIQNCNQSNAKNSQKSNNSFEKKFSFFNYGQLSQNNSKEINNNELSKINFSSSNNYRNNFTSQTNSQKRTIQPKCINFNQNLNNSNAWLNTKNHQNIFNQIKSEPKSNIFMPVSKKQNNHNIFRSKQSKNMNENENVFQNGQNDETQQNDRFSIKNQQSSNILNSKNNEIKNNPFTSATKSTFGVGNAFNQFSNIKYSLKQNENRLNFCKDQNSQSLQNTSTKNIFGNRSIVSSKISLFGENQAIYQQF